jgi:O-antigen/teichoic acid export membrane protein
MTQSVSARIFYGVGRLTWYVRLTLVEAVANLVLSVTLIGPLGIDGVAWGTTIPNLAFGLAVAVSICRLLDVPLADYAARALVRPVGLGLLLAGCWATAAALVDLSTWTAWVITGAAGTLGYTVLAVLLELGPRATWARVARLIPGRKPALQEQLSVGSSPVVRL